MIIALMSNFSEKSFSTLDLIDGLCGKNIFPHSEAWESSAIVMTPEQVLDQASQQSCRYADMLLRSH